MRSYACAGVALLRTCASATSLAEASLSSMRVERLSDRRAASWLVGWLVGWSKFYRFPWVKMLVVNRTGPGCNVRYAIKSVYPNEIPTEFLGPDVRALIEETVKARFQLLVKNVCVFLHFDEFRDPDDDDAQLHKILLFSAVTGWPQLGPQICDGLGSAGKDGEGIGPHNRLRTYEGPAHLAEK